MAGKARHSADPRLRSAWESVFRGVLPGVLVGCVALAWMGAPATALRTNVLGLVTPMLIAGLRARRFATLSSRGATVLGAICLVLTAGSLLGPSDGGVTRWVAVGATRMHVSAQFTPLILLAIVDLAMPATFGAALALAAGLQFIHVLQPDAAQAGAFGVALLWVAGSAPVTGACRASLMGVAVGGACGAWLRPRHPVPRVFVDDILSRAAQVSPWLALALCAGLVALGIELWRLARGARTPAQRAGACAALAYFAVNCVAALLGPYPMPVVSLGGGPIIGGVLATVWLGARAGRVVPATSSPATSAQRTEQTMVSAKCSPVDKLSVRRVTS